VQLAGGYHVPGQGFDQRVDQAETPAHPLGHRRALQVHAFTRVDLRLPIERKVVGVLGGQDVGQQPRSGKPPSNRPRRRFDLHDALARRAGKLRTHVPDHPETRRHVIEHLRDVLADLAHRRTAVRTVAGRLVQHLLARQVIGQRPAHRRRLLLRLGSGRRGLLRLGALQFFQPQLVLFDLPVKALGGAAELHALELCDQKLQVFDLGQIQLELCSLLEELRALLEHQCLERFEVIGQRC